MVQGDSLRLSNQEEVLSELRSMSPSRDYHIYLPHCLRSEDCPAKPDSGYITCTNCNTLRSDGDPCYVGEMTKIAREIAQNLKVYVLPGGSVLPKIIKEYGKPRRVLGVACDREIEQGEALMGAVGIESHTLGLTKDGCSETSVDLSEYRKTLKSLLG
jgi:hypothetical protein